MKKHDSLLNALYENTNKEQKEEIKEILCEHKYMLIINSNIKQVMCVNCGQIKN